MRKNTWHIIGCGSAAALILGCGSPKTTALESESTKLVKATTPIPMWVFSASPSLGARSGSVSDRKDPNYSALMVFMDKVAEYTNGTVTFSQTTWTSANGVIKQVGINGDGMDTAYDSGTALNSTWGFVFNSATPFGLDFEAMVPFPYEEGGLALAQALVDEKGLNVKLLPVVGSPPQMSGYFKHPVGEADCKGEAECKAETPIGLEGLCQGGWTWRYLPPGPECYRSGLRNTSHRRHHSRETTYLRDRHRGGIDARFRAARKNHHLRVRHGFG